MSMHLEYHLVVNDKNHVHVFETLEQVRLKVNSSHSLGTVSKSTVAKELRRLTNSLPMGADADTRNKHLKAIYACTLTAERRGDLYAPVWVSSRPVSIDSTYDMEDADSLRKAIEYAIEGRAELRILPRKNKAKLSMNICADTYSVLYCNAETLGVDPAILVECALDEYFKRGEESHG